MPCRRTGLPHRLRRCRGDDCADPSVSTDVQPLGRAGRHFVRMATGEDDGKSALRQSGEHVFQTDLLPNVQPGGRVVQHQQPGLFGECPREQYAARFAVGERDDGAILEKLEVQQSDEGIQPFAVGAARLRMARADLEGIDLVDRVEGEEFRNGSSGFAIVARLWPACSAVLFGLLRETEQRGLAGPFFVSAAPPSWPCP